MKNINHFLKLNFTFACVFIASYVNAQTVTYRTSTGTSNPYYNESSSESIINTESSETSTSGWTAMSIAGSVSTNAWSSSVNFSTISSTFAFKFYNTSVTSFKVSSNGLLTFSSSTTAPSSSADNAAFPSTGALASTIAGFWDYFSSYKTSKTSTTINKCTTGSDDKVYYKLIGTYPKRQLWIKWVSFKMGTGVGSSCSGATIPDGLYFSVVLEESTNKIYVVDQYRGSNYSNMSATIGVQNTTTSGVNYSSSAKLAGTSSSSYTDNTYYCFTPTENTVSSTTLTFTGTTQLPASGSYYQYYTLPTASLLTKTLSAATLYVDFSTGDDNNCGTSAFTSSVSVKAEALVSGSTTYTTLFTKTLSLSNTTPEQLKITDLTADYSTYTKIKITVSSYVKPAVACSSNVKLTAWVEESYGVKVTTAPYDTYPMLRLSKVTSTTTNPVTFSWSTDCQYVPQYQLQVLKLYNTNSSYTTATNCQAYVDWDKALTFDVTGGATSISLFMAEGKGYYVWRVRPIGSYYSGGVANSLNWGTWSTSYFAESTTTYYTLTSSSSYDDLFYLDYAENSKNWIYNRKFTENSGISEHMTFADGLQRVRQSQHHIPTDGKYLISQSLYDYSGRNALNSMAVPVTGTTFDYAENLLTYGGKLYKPKDFDSTSTYNSPNNVDGGSLNSYYSDANTDTKVPSADKYPYSRTLFMEDGTNRQKEAGGPGSIFRIGGGSTSGSTTTSRTTKVYFQSATNAELIQMFGAEAPVDSSVYKIISVDANKTTTVTYQTIDGKILATCLSGTSGSPLQALTYSAQTISDTITGFNNNGCAEHSLLIQSGSVSLPLTYTITPAEIEEACGSGYCSTCDYNIEIYVKNVETGTMTLDTVYLLESAACGSSGWSYTNSGIHLDAGSFVIGRCITANNTDASSIIGETYKQEILNEVADVADNDNDAVWANLKTKYENGEITSIDSVYSYIKNDLGITIADGATDVTILASEASSCCSVTLPMLTCGDTPGDFEQLLYDSWGKAGFGYYPYNYFYNYKTYVASTYGDRLYYADKNATTTPAQFKITSADGDATHDCRLTLYFDNIKIIDDVSIGNGATAINALTAQVWVLIVNYLNTHYGSNWPYNITYYATNYIKIEPNINNGGKLTGNIIGYDESGNNYYVMDHSDLSFDAHITYVDATKGIGGKGMFNTLIDNMVTYGGYDRDTLWRYWKGCVAAYPMLQFIDGDRTASKKRFDLLQHFLKLVGTTRANYTAFGDAYLKYAYYYVTGDKTYFKSSNTWFDTCVSEYDFDLSSYAYTAGGVLDPSLYSTSEAKDSVWNSFNDCLFSADEFADASPDDGNALDAAGYRGTDCENNNFSGDSALVEAQEDTCQKICKLRFMDFYKQAQIMCNANHITVSDQVLWCFAYQMKEQCESDCELSLPYTMQDLDGDGSKESKVAGSVSDADRNDAMKAMMYDTDLQPSTCTTCSSYKKLTSTSYFSIVLASELTDKLTAYVAAGNTTVTTDVIQSWIDEIYDEYDVTEYIPDGCNKVGISGGGPFIINSSSAFSIVTSGTSDYLKLKYSAGYKSWFAMTTSCDFTLNCTIYFKWIQPNIVPTISVTIRTCEQESVEYLMSLIEQQLNDCKNQKLAAMDLSYKKTCANPSNVNDQLVISYQQGYHHYTLYYYDRGGNLVKTVPPKGTTDIGTSRATSPSRTYATTYIYDSFKRLTQKTTPDGGSTYCYYNSLGQLRFSQNAQQTSDGTYSYIKYDNLGRSSESGLVTASASDISANIEVLTYPTTNCTQKTLTTYTTANASATYITDGSAQQFLQNRVSYAYTDADGDLTTLTDQVYTYFSYDAHGNVNWLIQNIYGLDKQYIKFEYDLISNKITKVIYNESRLDQIYHRYTYDADNRITKVETSVDGKIWDKDAQYEYYYHGGVKRLKLGEDKIQGLDFVYNLQGWLKAVNFPSMSTTYDPGQDNLSTGSNASYAKDAFAMELSYYNGDFNRTGSVFTDATSGSYSDTAITGYGSLYNGMIAGQSFNNSLASTTSGYYKGGTALAGVYTYDDFGRYVKQTLNYYSSSKWNAFTTSNDYAETVAYDDNGNITSYSRNGYNQGTAASPKNYSMDNMTYNYISTTSNQLKYIKDATTTTTTYTTDIESGQSTSGNYTYDLAGNLKTDAQQKITAITWGVNNKVKSVAEGSGTTAYTLSFLYDAMGNRVKKTSTPTSGSATYTYYVYDPNKNLMALYEATGTGTITQTEAPIYASNRIGAITTGLAVNTAYTAPTDGIYSRTISSSTSSSRKKYELKDHLGNIRAVVNDVKSVSGSTYTANVLSAIDYYPFGMNMPGRDYNGSNSKIGFQGKYKDNDIWGNNNAYDFGARIHDPRVGRWLSLDPLADNYPSKSPYNYCSNNPISRVDPTGRGDKPSGTWSLDLANWVDEKIDVAEDYYVGHDDADGLENGTQKTVLDIARGALTAPLRIGVATSDAVDRVTAPGADGYDYAIAAAEVLTDGCTTVGTAATLAVPMAKGAAALGAPESISLPTAPKPTPSAVKPTPPATPQLTEAEARASGWKNPDGSTAWPPNRGAVAGTEVENATLPKGAVIDRYGHPGGSFTAEGGTPYAERALPSGTNAKPYTAYEVTTPIEGVRTSVAAPWFDEVGGGVQYDLPYSVLEHQWFGDLQEIPGAVLTE